MATHLSTHLSTSVLHFQPGATPSTFAVSVSNRSAEFATFQLELLASGVAPGAAVTWYRQAPDLSAKIPPGDRTQFSIEVVDVPPVPGGFVGAMSLTVRVFSLELREEDRQVLKLIVEGSGIMPPRLELLTPDLQVCPGTAIELPLRLYNPNRSPMRVNLSLRGLPPEWLPEGHERRLEIPPLHETLTAFSGQIGSPTETLSQVYPFELEARVTAMVSNHLQGQVTVLPAGQIHFELATPVVTYPSILSPPDPANPKSTNPAAILLNLHNQSNRPQTLMPVVERVATPIFRTSAKLTRPLRRSDRLTLPATPVSLAIGEPLALQLPIEVARPWIGWARTHQFQITTRRADTSLPLEPEIQEVQVRSRPRVRIWIQLVILGLLAGVGLMGLLLPPKHRGTVNMVRFDGRASEVLSASEDQTVRRWQIRGDRLHLLQQIVRADKAARVARYRPVGNDTVAVGYENGTTEIFNLRLQQPPLVLQHDLDDRVFDLQFTSDAQSLFTGYGSGEVRRWDLSGFPGSVLQPVQEATVGFAIQALAIVGQTQSQLAIGGRFNQLVMWDWQQQSVTPIPYSSQGDDLDYITSLATTENLPDRLAVADNQGRISLWNVGSCRTGDTCRPLDDWQEGDGQQPIQAIALSDDGCYLVSGSEDGQTKLWQLQADGVMVRGQTLGKSRQAIESVDVIRQEDGLLIVTGGRDHRVRLHTVANAPACRP